MCTGTKATWQDQFLTTSFDFTMWESITQYSTLVWYRFTRCFMETSLGRDWDRYKESAMPRHEDMLTNTTCAAAPVATESVVEATPYNSSGGPIVQLLYNLLYNYCTTIVQPIVQLISFAKIKILYAGASSAFQNKKIFIILYFP